MDGIACGFLVFGIWFLLQIFIAIWMYRDAGEKGMEPAVVWLLIALLFNVLGLIVYLLVREQKPPPRPQF